MKRISMIIMAKKNNKEAKQVKRTTQESIPYLHVFDNGIIETSPGVFTKSYKSKPNFYITF